MHLEEELTKKTKTSCPAIYNHQTERFNIQALRNTLEQ